MPNRIEHRFAELRAQDRAGFIPYICAGDPNFACTVEIALALEKAGADLVELGVPFSDPLADGIVNQLAAQRALEAGATVAGVLDCASQIRQNSEIPIVLYTYLNPIFQCGLEDFYRCASTAGVDGLLILDLPPDEDQTSGHPFTHIRLIAPTTPSERMAMIAKAARGFIYYVSREGVTGARDSMAESLQQNLALIRQYSDVPIAVGFGISNAEQAAQVAAIADAVVVGSAIVDLIGRIGNTAQLAERVGSFAAPIADAIHARVNPRETRG